MKKYSSKKWELLALKWPLSFTFIVLTDNNPLTNLQPKNKLRAVEQRWVPEVANFCFSFKYCAGKQNTNADALSHLNWAKHDECDIGQVEAALAFFLNTTAVAESLRDQLVHSTLEQPTMDPLRCNGPIPS